MSAPDEFEDLERARRLVEQSSRIVALTGAGISTDSGIPDFRGPNGVWTKDPEAERLSTIDVYLSEPEVRRRAWQHRLDSPTWSALPNRGHEALVRLQERGKLERVITQNVDGLHLRAGNHPELVTEIHGTMREVVCTRCGERSPMESVLERVLAGEQDPPCRTLQAGGLQCGGILKSATVMFGENLVPGDLVRAERSVRDADLLLSIGTTLTVYPAAGLVPFALGAGTPVIIINAEATPYDSDADLVLRGPISDVLDAIV
jgi:NAD-dependent deacetylase